MSRKNSPLVPHSSPLCSPRWPGQCRLPRGLLSTVRLPALSTAPPWAPKLLGPLFLPSLCFHGDTASLGSQQPPQGLCKKMPQSGDTIWLRDVTGPGKPLGGASALLPALPTSRSCRGTWGLELPGLRPWLHCPSLARGHSKWGSCFSAPSRFMVARSSIFFSGFCHAPLTLGPMELMGLGDICVGHRVGAHLG